MSAPFSMAVKPVGQSALSWWRKAFFYLNGYHKYGLMSNDILYVTPVVREALKRLPQKDYDERQHRIARAINIYLHGEVLPKYEWTKFEDDRKYLQPYIDLVKREIADKKFYDRS